MNDSIRLGSLFDPQSELSIREHVRPHWSQAGAIVFITFRTADSIPQEVLRRWEREKQGWLQRHGCSPDRYWSEVLPTLDPALQFEFKKTFQRSREKFLDRCQGECVLRKPELAQIIAQTLLHFDGQRYRMGDFIVMPNHVHLLAVFASQDALTAQCDSWLHYSARQINLALGRKGKFWQQEPFDHLVRSTEQYDYLRTYIRDNGTHAGLPKSDYYYHRYLRQE
ncbi:hypothetical protein M4951_15850 [Blastopirellula sp. J2-11]|uniref:transposase n=1 Tax=Blastopirellula sp. J2-11 TaxID=2943192 RepID=UPI0021C7AFEE|nr:transposase [Blastopirellula sp. J2-11]UUO04859.1 hypothetical protein M4951_15850 [Blastopirellula sp. J2-11]